MHLGTYANSADTVQTPHNAVSDQDIHCLPKEMSVQKESEIKSTTGKP